MYKNHIDSPSPPANNVDRKLNRQIDNQMNNTDKQRDSNIKKKL